MKDELLTRALDALAAMIKKNCHVRPDGVDESYVVTTPGHFGETAAAMRVLVDAGRLTIESEEFPLLICRWVESGAAGVEAGR